MTSDAHDTRRTIDLANPRLVLGMAADQPPGVKQLAQLCLILIYPAILAFVLVALVVQGVWWLLAKTLGKLLFELWWLCTGWFWRKHGGVKPGSRS